MIIAFVLDDTLDRPDGVQQYILTLGKWLTATGHTVHYLVSSTERTDVPNTHSLGRYITVNFNGNRVRTPLPANKRRIRQLLLQLEPDVLHVQLPCSPLLAGRVIDAAPSKTAIVGTFHILPAARWHNYANSLLWVALRRNLGRFTSVIAVSKPAADFARTTYRLSTVVIPPAIDISAVRTALPRRQPREVVKIAFLGRLVQRKGVLQLIRAFNALPSDIIDLAKLNIGGGGQLMSEAVKLAGTNQRIDFTGFVDESSKLAFLADADIAVFPSTSGESFGIILIEAMAAGAGVVIAGNNPGYASVLGSNPESLIDPGDVSAFSNVLDRYITHANARSKLHSHQQHTLEQYDISKIGPEVLHVYERAVESHNQ